VLTRLLQSDPALEGVGLVIFDEFHERSLQADLGLALCLEAQATLRPDLRLLIMSATLDGVAIAKLLGDAPLLTSEGQSFPAETRYAKHPPLSPTEREVTTTILRVLKEEPGDMLVFLPGSAEIRRVAGQLEQEALGAQVVITPPLWRSPLERPGAGYPAESQRPAQGGAGYLHRRDQPDNRGDPGGDRQRADAGAPF
jgi:ATP-dependent helicase HrpB